MRWRRWPKVRQELRMPKNMTWDEEMKLGRGEGRRKKQLFSFPPGTGLQGRKNHFLVCP